MKSHLLVIEDHGVVLSLLAIVLTLFGGQLILEVVRRQPELQDVHRLLFLHELQGTRNKNTGRVGASYQIDCMWETFMFALKSLTPNKILVLVLSPQGFFFFVI